MTWSSSSRPLRPRAIATIVLVAAVGLLGNAAAAQAAVIAIGTTITDERAVVHAEGGLQTTVVQLSVAPGADGGKRPRAGAAVVVPVPATPEVATSSAPADRLVAELDAATRPRTTASEAARQRGDDAALRAVTPDFLDYETTTYDAGDDDAVVRALTADELAPSADQRRLLSRYAADDWAFVVLRVEQPITAPATLRPLELRFAADEPRYPVRAIGDVASPLTLYVAGPHRVTAAGFDTFHAGWVVDLDPALTPEAQGLLGGAEYVTRLGRNGNRIEQLRTEQGVSDRLFRASAEYPNESEDAFATAPLPNENAPEVPYEGAPGWLWLVVLPAVVVLVALVGFAMRWRSARTR